MKINIQTVASSRDFELKMHQNVFVAGAFSHPIEEVNAPTNRLAGIGKGEKEGENGKRIVKIFTVLK